MRSYSADNLPLVHKSTLRRLDESVARVEGKEEMKKEKEKQETRDRDGTIASKIGMEEHKGLLTSDSTNKGKGSREISEKALAHINLNVLEKWDDTSGEGKGIAVDVDGEVDNLESLQMVEMDKLRDPHLDDATRKGKKEGDMDGEKVVEEESYNLERMWSDGLLPYNIMELKTSEWKEREIERAKFNESKKGKEAMREKDQKAIETAVEAHESGGKDRAETEIERKLKGSKEKGRTTRKKPKGEAGRKRAGSGMSIFLHDTYPCTFFSIYPSIDPSSPINQFFSGN